MTLHESVLPAEVLAFLNVRSQGRYIDCTFGGGGHTEAIVRRLSAQGSMLALELDADARERGLVKLAQYQERLTIYQGNFRRLGAIAQELGITSVDGILYDFGLSMDLIRASGRGFSFLVDEPLDMRFDVSEDFTAADLLNTWSEVQIADIIYYFGEEQYARRIAKGVVARRAVKPFATTSDLVEVIQAAVPASYRHKKTHPATKTFQAVRMAVNDELGAIEESLAAAMALLAPEGRLLAISFHSLEDRLVKNLFKSAVATGDFTAVTKKPIVPSEEEVKRNPASRSSKLRVLEKKASQ